MADKNEDTTNADNQIEKSNVKTRFFTFFRLITVEPVVFLFCMGMAINLITTESLIIRKYCLNQMGYPDEICSNLTYNKTLEEQAQNMATNFILYKTLLENLPSIGLTLFIGAWSDKNGRKFLLTLPTLGGAIGMVMMIFNAYYMTEMNVNYILVAAIPYALGGNFLTIMTGGMSYMADITDTSQRTVRFGFVQSAFLCGNSIGLLSGGMIFDKFGYITVYVVNLIIYILALMYILIGVKETIHLPAGQTSNYGSLFKLDNFKENMSSVFKKRQHNGRFHLFLLLIVAAVSFLPLYGMSLVLPVMTVRLKLHDLIIGVISASTRVVSELIIAISTKGWMLFAGKISAVMSAAEAVTPAIGSILFTQVYNITRLVFPGTIYVMSAVLNFIPAACFGWIYAQRRKLENHSEYKEDL
uniref:Major facilitator superfamily (MFS) profile domain-containing protein n=1 Tax=Strigamia maritima TaxID=126957 RepID=T1JMB4_STRMM